jgi:hypothetical protein
MNQSTRLRQLRVMEVRFGSRDCRLALAWSLTVILLCPCLLSGQTPSTNYSVGQNGVVTLELYGSGTQPVTGSARLSPAGGLTTPSGMAIFSYRQNEILISEAAVPAIRRTVAARTSIESGNGIRTGIAISNPNAVPVTVTFVFTTSNGEQGRTGTLAVPPNGQTARFADEDPFNEGTSFSGSLSLYADQPVGITALRGRLNERNEFLVTALDVADLSDTREAPSVIPHYAAGGGWATSTILTNPFDAPIAGEIQFMDPSGAGPAETARYHIAERAAQTVETAGRSADLHTGWIRIVPDNAAQTPVSTVVVSYRNAGVTVTETGLSAVRPAASSRLFIDAMGWMSTGEAGALRTGIALANPSSKPSEVHLDLNGTGAAAVRQTTVTIPPGGQVAVFIDQIPGYESLPIPFRGLLSVRTANPDGIAVTGLRGRYNERGDFLITSTPAAVDGELPNRDLIPHFAFAGGYTTTVVLLGAAAGSSSGTLSGYSRSGEKLALPGSVLSSGMPQNLGPWNNDFAISESGDGLHFMRRGLFVERAGVPAMTLAADGRLFAVFQWFPVDRPSHFDKIAVMVSQDDGLTWSAPRTIQITGMPGTLYRSFDPMLTVLSDGRFRLYFSSERGTPQSPRGNRAVFSAVSDDGFHYVFEPGQRFGLDNAETYDPALALLGNTWHLYCPIAPGSGYHATSSDGLNFVRQPDVLAASQFQFLGAVIPAKGGLRFYGSGPNSVLFSPDGSNWQPEQSQNPPDPDPGVTVTRAGTTLGIHIGFSRQDASTDPPNLPQ